jgi:hypothetical protein
MPCPLGTRLQPAFHVALLSEKRSLGALDARSGQYSPREVLCRFTELRYHSILRVFRAIVRTTPSKARPPAFRPFQFSQSCLFNLDRAYRLERHWMHCLILFL